VSDAHQHLKQKAGSKMREYLVIPSYLFVVLSRLVVHRSMVLAAPHIDYKLHGFALINALAIAMLLLVAQDPHLADRFLVIGKIHGRSFQESTSNLGSGTWNGILTLSALVFVVLIPFFSFTELRRVLDADWLVSVFFRPRNQFTLNLPPARA